MSKKIFTTVSLLLAMLFMVCPAQAQILTKGATQPELVEMADSVHQERDIGPFFGLYKDNYFTVGTTIGKKPTALNSDVKFQISLAIRLTNATLPWGTYLYLFYTQKTFWNVFQESLPMHDMNFNPGIGLTKPFYIKNRYVGRMSLILEHESNGRDSIWSRSWNRLALSGSVMLTRHFLVHAKYWIPIVDSDNNSDIVKYAGWCQWGMAITSPEERFYGGLTFVMRGGWNFKCNVIAEFAWRVSKKTNLNLYAQYYYGYGEDLLDYNQLHSRLRVGLVFRPRFFSEY